MRCWMPAAALLGAAALSACSRPVQVVQNVAFEGQATLARREAQIAQAAEEQGWRVLHSAPGRTRVAYTYTEHRIVLDILYNESIFSFQYVSSSGLSYDGTTVHRAYNNWVSELERQILARSVA